MLKIDPYSFKLCFILPSLKLFCCLLNSQMHKTFYIDYWEGLFSPLNLTQKNYDDWWSVLNRFCWKSFRKKILCFASYLWTWSCCIPPNWLSNISVTPGIYTNQLQYLILPAPRQCQYLTRNHVLLNQSTQHYLQNGTELIFSISGQSLMTRNWLSVKSIIFTLWHNYSYLCYWYHTYKKLLQIKITFILFSLWKLNLQIQYW